ncbi:MAG: hypothetical protein AAFZ52_20030, partial [Bacteroidota bacterium]
MEQKIFPLIADLLGAVKTTAIYHPELAGHQLTTVCQLYQDYFSRPRQDPDEDPPTSEDPAIEALLYNIWLVIVEREKAQKDTYLLAGLLPGPNGPITTLNELYHFVFTGLLHTPDEEEESAAWDPATILALLPELVAEINTELGLTLTNPVDSTDYPPQVQEFLDGATQEFDPVQYEECLELIAQYEDLPILPFHLIGQLLASDRFAEALTAARIAADRFPDSARLVTLYLSLLPSPEELLQEAHRFGTPPDMKRFAPQSDGTYSLAQYCLFEKTCLDIDIAAGRGREMLFRMERLLRLSFPEMAILEKIPYHFDRLTEAEIDRGNVLPNTWTAPLT